MVEVDHIDEPFEALDIDRLGVTLDGLMALTFEGKGRIPSLLTLWPRKLITGTPNWHFSSLITNP